ncbi:MAG: YqaA family protein [Planctomycetota bacterium]
MPDFEVWGPIGLFAAAFLAGSILPFPSEGVLAALVAQDHPAARMVLVATIGNVLGAVTVYGIGVAIERGWWRRDDERHARARRAIGRWGAWSLLLAWLPIVGDLLVLGAGLLRVRFDLFLVLTTVGKALRYGAVAAGVAHAFG